MNRSMPGLPVHHQLPESIQNHVHPVSDAIQPSHPLSSLLLLPPIPPSIRVFSNESTLCTGWPKYWSFSFSIGPSNERPGLISSRMDWLDLLAVQGTLKSLLQHHISKASIFRCSAFFTVQLSHSYMTTGKTIALTRWIFVDKVMSLLFNMLSMLVITFLPRSKRLLISWLQSPSAVILEHPKIKSDTVSTVSHLFPIKRCRLPTPIFLGFPGGSDGKGSTCKVGDLGLILGLGRSPGEGHGNPLQYSCLENPYGQRSLATVHGITKGQTQLSKQSTAHKTIKMTLLRPLMTNFKVTVRTDCAVSAWSCCLCL